VNDKLTRKFSEAITTRRPAIDPHMTEAIVLCRQAQGWRLLDKDDMKLMAAAWKQQLDRRGVAPQLYVKMVQMAIDHRTFQIEGGAAQPTPLTVELLLAMFERYKREIYDKYRDLKLALASARETGADADVIERLEDRVATYLIDNYLEEST
jgi:hypothetical protein